MEWISSFGYYTPFLYLIFLAVVLFFYLKKGKGLVSFIKNILVPCTIFGGLIVYFIGYHMNAPGRWVSNSLQAVYSTCRLFLMGNDLVEIKDKVHGNPTFILWFSVINTSAAFIFVFVFLNLFGKLILNKIRVRFNNPKSIYIFYGVNEPSILLGNDIISKNGKKFIAYINNLDSNETDNMYYKIESIGAFILSRKSPLESLKLNNEDSIISSNEKKDANVRICVNNDYLSKFHLLSKVLKKPTHLFFLTENEDVNIRSALSAIGEISTGTVSTDITLYIRIKSTDLEELYYKRLSPKIKGVTLRFINDAEITARQLLMKCHPVDFVEPDSLKSVAKSDFNLMLVGFGNTGDAVLRKLVEAGQFVGNQFNAWIIDKDVNSRAGSFMNRYPGISKICNIRFLQMETGEVRFFDLIRENFNTLDLIIIALGDDTLNVHTAVDIHQLILKKNNVSIRTLIRMKDDDNYDCLFLNDENKEMIFFGREKNIYTEDIILRERLEITARKVHAFYSKNKSTSVESWNLISRTKQLSNISVAEHFHAKLKMTGLSVEKIKSMNDVNEFVSYLNEESLRNLAIGEHLRWAAQLYVNGWDTWQLSSIPVDATSNKDEDKKLHACLVNWDDLAAVNERFGEDYYSYDTNNVINMFYLIRECF